MILSASLTSAIVAPVPRGLVPMPKSVSAGEATGPGFPSFLPAECNELLESEARPAVRHLRRTAVPGALDAAARCEQQPRVVRHDLRVGDPHLHLRAARALDHLVGEAAARRLGKTESARGRLNCSCRVARYF